MRILLARPNYSSHIITPPIGLGYLASYLNHNGIEAFVLDGLRENLDLKSFIKRIIEVKPDIVGITCLTAFYNEAINLAQAVKGAGIKCIIGGTHPTFLPHKTLVDSGADYVICGEGEIPLLKLLRDNFNNRGIPGLYSRVDFEAGQQTIKKAEIIKNLDEIPFPDWDQINPNLYPKAPHGAIVKNFPIGVIITSRGCPYQCTFCASPKFYDRTIRFRSPENVVLEIEHLINKHGIKEIHFEDDNLTLKRDYAVEICNLIIDKKLKISWACPNGVRADSIDEQLVKLMAKSGCYYFAIGIESANTEILEKIKKNLNMDSVLNTIELARQNGISCQGFFIFGLPGETEKTIKETIDFAKSSNLARAQFLILDILPGSELWDNLNGEFTPNWNKDSYREPEWIPSGLSKETLLKAQSEAFRQFYLRPKIFFSLAKLINFCQIKYLIRRLKDYRLLNPRGLTK